MLLAGLEPGPRLVLGADARHLRSVLRVRVGEEVVAFDGQGMEAVGRVEAVSPDGVAVRLEAPREGGREPGAAITLAVALLKGDKLADVVRKGTELGVAGFRLFTCAHADVPAVSDGKLRRYRRIAREAAKQCGRDRVPEVSAAVGLADLPLEGKALVAVPEAPVTLRQALPSGSPRAVTLVSGPEGGLRDDEVAGLVARGADAVRLGPRVLRAETAPVALAAAVLVPDGR